MGKSVFLRAPQSRGRRAIAKSSLVVLAAIFEWFGFSPAQASTVYVLRGGDVFADEAGFRPETSLVKLYGWAMRPKAISAICESSR
jgi:hypothetical protein